MLSCSDSSKIDNIACEALEERNLDVVRSEREFAKFIDILKEDEIKVIYTINRVYMTL